MKENRPYDYEHMMEEIERLVRKYPSMQVQTLGKSLLGRKIPLLCLGDPCAPGVLMVASHHGMEWITTQVLLTFVEDFIRLSLSPRHVYGIRPSCIVKHRCMYIVPMLNPDGVELQIHGLPEDPALRERLLFYNGGSNDFSRWQANAGGVDLNHNYDAGFAAYKRIEREQGIYGGAPTKYSGEYPESEPETSSLAGFIRRSEKLRMILTLHTQGEEIYYSSGDCMAPSSQRIASLFSRMTGYRTCVPTGTAAYGGLTDWYIRTFHRPSFTFECGRGQNPLPQSQASDIYEVIREALFTAPLLI